MGLFSRREKPPKSSSDPPIQSSYSTASVNSSGSRGAGIVNRISASSTAGLGSTTTPMSPNGSNNFKMPKIDLPRPPDPQLDPAGYLRSLVAVRERSRFVYDKAMRNELKHFDVDMSKMADVVSFVTNLIKVRLTHQLPRAIRSPTTSTVGVGATGRVAGTTEHLS